MDRFIIVFFLMTLTSRFFSETLRVVPKAIDLMDIVVIPLLFIISLTYGRTRHADLKLEQKLTRLTMSYIVLCMLSALVNFDRTFFGPLALFIFGMLEGPLLFLALNKLIRDKQRFGQMLARFINFMVLVEVVAVIFVSIPIFLATGNPDKVSGTFGNNAYQFSVFLVIIGGYFLARQTVSTKSILYSVGIQIFIFFTFILLQFRAALPAFFATYLVMASLLYGRKVLRLSIIVAIFGGIIYYALIFVQEKDFKLKYEDFQVLYENPEIVLQYGKAQSYTNSVILFGEEPLSLLVGTGPGTYVSRANYTFIYEIEITKDKGVAPILRAIFGDKDFSTEIHRTYIAPLNDLGTLFGSVQVNNPNSSILAVAVETGIPGLIIMGIMYGTLIASARRYVSFAKRVKDPILLQLACAFLGGVTYLVMITPLDNYLEIGRVTLPVWLLYWTVSTLAHQYSLNPQMPQPAVPAGLRRRVRPVPHMTRS